VISLDNVIVDEEFADKLRRMDEEDQVRELAQLILRDGRFTEPLIVWQHHNILIDGHRRLRIWQEVLGRDPDMEPEIHELAFKDRDEVRAYIYLRQLARRNAGDEEQAYYRGQLYELRKKQKGGQGGNKNAAKNESDAVSDSFSTADQVAKETGVTSRTVERDAAFARSVNALDAKGVLPKSQALSGAVPRKTVVEAAKQPTKEAATKVIKADKPKPLYPSSDLFVQWLETVRMRTDGILQQYGSLTKLMAEPTWDHNRDGIIHPMLAGLKDTVTTFEEEMAEWRKGAKKT
jgi:hypothetical protein